MSEAGQGGSCGLLLKLLSLCVASRSDKSQWQSRRCSCCVWEMHNMWPCIKELPVLQLEGTQGQNNEKRQNRS